MKVNCYPGTQNFYSGLAFLGSVWDRKKKFFLVLKRKVKCYFVNVIMQLNFPQLQNRIKGNLIEATPICEFDSHPPPEYNQGSSLIFLVLWLISIENLLCSGHEAAKESHVGTPQLCGAPPTQQQQEQGFWQRSWKLEKSGKQEVFQGWLLGKHCEKGAFRLHPFWWQGHSHVKSRERVFQKQDHREEEWAH